MVSLLTKILTDIPNRPRAACRKRWDLYDAIADNTAIPQQRAEAETLCSSCLHRSECQNSLTIEMDRRKSA
ncbi:hypothetical protein G9444_3852 [Rhodococcus erythropolis]|uniref:4Fe-4S Wbl-type domain-containing protein n=1 Tax=Rhodococcus erythropolis TaxID=1833 RepID=A0A6G9CWL0_RHOER|nr:hypothetical protein G9444_3852 [Rhodococcus erythropolis]